MLIEVRDSANEPTPGVPPPAVEEGCVARLPSPPDPFSVVGLVDPPEFELLDDDDRLSFFPAALPSDWPAGAWLELIDDGGEDAALEAGGVEVSRAEAEEDAAEAMEETEEANVAVSSSDLRLLGAGPPLAPFPFPFPFPAFFLSPLVPLRVLELEFLLDACCLPDEAAAAAASAASFSASSALLSFSF